VFITRFTLPQAEFAALLGVTWALAPAECAFAIGTIIAWRIANSSLKFGTFLALHRFGITTISILLSANFAVICHAAT